MANNKRGKSPFFQTDRRTPMPVEREKRLQNGILIVNRFFVGILQKQKAEIISIIQGHINKSFLSGTIYEKKNGVESLYILLNIEINTSETIKELRKRFNHLKNSITVENKHLDITGKKVEPIEEDSIQNDKQKVVKKDSIVNDKDKKAKPQLRIDFALEDVEELFEFLKNKPINRQTRKRYKDVLTDTTKPIISGKDESNRSTFVAEEVVFDKEDISIYINGKISSDICCRIEEKTDAYILHLFYRGARQYSKSININKDEAKEPITRINYSDKDNILSVNGKRLAITFEGYDAYRRHKNGKGISDKTPDTHTTIKYEGRPIRKRKTAIVKQTVVEKNQEEINVKISGTSKQSKESDKEVESATVTDTNIPTDSHKPQVKTIPDGKKSTEETTETDTLTDTHEPQEDSTLKKGNVCKRLWNALIAFVLKLFRIK